MESHWYIEAKETIDVRGDCALRALMRGVWCVNPSFIGC